MHLFKKTLGLIVVLSVFPTAFAATGRPTTDARVSYQVSRMPNITNVVSNTSNTVTSGEEISATAFLKDADCIDAYRECITADNACGEDLADCTTKELFHGQMPKCLSILAQCSSDGITTLFGTSTISKFADMSSGNYVYPTDGSVLGQMITAASLANRYDTATCVRRYTSCLKSEDVCGSDFELCTDEASFKKQNLLCESTFARCDDAGKTALFGSTNSSVIGKDSRVAEMIKEGDELAGLNAVNTCYKVIDRCFENACSENPFKCKPTTSELVASIAGGITNGDDVDKITQTIKANLENYTVINSSSVNSYIRNACESTIGANRHCYLTLLEKNPTTRQLNDPANQRDVFDRAYAARKQNLESKIDGLISEFDVSAKQKCTNTVKSCAMRVCGGGSGAACYARVLGQGRTNDFASINSGNATDTGTYDEIKSGCEQIVNTDSNCQYAYYSANATDTFVPTYSNASVFGYVFPKYVQNQNNDPIGVVASLNASLATSYNDAAIAQLKKQCQNIAKSCIQSVCGDDYINCYRNRTDIGATGTYNTSNKDFNDSMNWVGGVLDNNIVIGLCLDTIKNASSCEEQLEMGKEEIITNHTETTYSWDKGIKVSTTSWTTTETTNPTGAESARDLWLNSNIVTGYCTSKTNGCNASVQKACDTVENGCVYDEPVTETGYTYAMNQSAKNILSEVLQDVEMQAQQQYNAKLNKEKRMCDASNTGGLVGNSGNDRTFMWARLKKDVPSDYSISGLSTKDFEESNNLNNSFCRVRITLQSDDKKIQEVIKGKGWATAYFATGDAFTCGSWIPESALNDMAKKIVGTNSDGDLTKGQKWGVAGMSVLSAIGGGVGADLLQSKTDIGGLLHTTANDLKGDNVKTSAKICYNLLDGINSGNVEDKEGDIESAMKAVAGIRGEYIELKTAYDKLQGVLDGGKFDDKVKAVAKLQNECSRVSQQPANADDKTKWNKTGRVFVDLTSATLGGVAGGITTAQIMKASNRAKFTEAEQEFMNTIGNHISCYIGGTEAGSYGDVITTSIE